MSLTRAKRQRSRRTRSASEDLADDYLMHMDPAAMTERQQLAFLLRKTAHEQDDATRGSDDPSDDEHEDAKRVRTKPKKRIYRTLSERRTTRSTRADAAADRDRSRAASLPAQGYVIYSGRGRPPKNAIKLAPGQTAADVEKHAARTPRGGRHARPKRLQMKAAAASPLSDSDVDMASADAEAEAEAEVDAAPRSAPARSSRSRQKQKQKQKPSPSSTSDVTHMEVFEDHDDHEAQTEFWRRHCALCSQPESTSPCDSACDALFLCPSCDHKYPTQRALGRV